MYRSYLTKGIVGLMAVTCFDIMAAETLKNIREEIIESKAYVLDFPHVHQDDYSDVLVPSIASPLSASGSIQSTITGVSILVVEEGVTDSAPGLANLWPMCCRKGSIDGGLRYPESPKGNEIAVTNLRVTQELNPDEKRISLRYHN